MIDYQGTLEAIREARLARDRARDRLYALQIERLARPDADAIDQRIAEARQQARRQERAVADHIGQLFVEQSPERLIESWDDGVPILLLPLRLETRFQLEGNGGELWVRVFPDDVAVNTHEKVLTGAQATHGRAYWEALLATTDAGKRRDAWLALAKRWGANRAAWVALQTKPRNWAALAGGNGGRAEPDWPTIELTKPDSWSEAPHTRVLPDRFVLLAYRDGQPAMEPIVGELVADTVQLGPAPLENGDLPSIRRDPTDHRLRFEESLTWLIDFDEAVARGLGFKVRLDARSARDGFDQLLVLGLKHSADASDGKVLLEGLLDNHRFSVNGLELVPQGAATNNIDEQGSSFARGVAAAADRAFIDEGEAAFEPRAERWQASDGQRLADYLGISYATLVHVGGAGGRDYAEAVAANQALYAGTLGYFLNSMLNEVLSTPALRRMRTHFTRHVTGRGPLPAIRVGKQPYGVLLTSAFGDWAPEIDRTAPTGGFEVNLQRFLSAAEGRWQDRVDSLPHIGKPTDAAANLLGVLGLHPNSVDLYQRVGYSVDHLRNQETFIWGQGQFAADIMEAFVEGLAVRKLLKDFGYDERRPGGQQKPAPLLIQLIWRHYHTRVGTRNLIDGQPLAEDRGIGFYDSANQLNYIHWLIAHAASHERLEQQDFGGVAAPTAMLYLMLRNALLIESSVSVGRFLEKNGIVADELVRSRKFMNMSAAPSVSTWEVFRAPADVVVEGESSRLPLYQLVHSERFSDGTDVDIAGDLNEGKRALEDLKDLPTARLERVLVEHLDTLSYRLDSWQTSAFDVRAHRQRRLAEPPEKRRDGIYLGGYGYLEQVRPAHTRTRVAEASVLPEPLREGRDNLYVEQGNGGYVHAPSLNHATAAAILRNGYLTHASPAEREPLAVNLSSERVRRAKYLLDGIRNGQSLEALLGYQFERGLHDWSTRTVDPIILNDLKPYFRQAFPIRRTRIPQRADNGGPTEVVETYQVVNGLELAQRTDDFPYGIAALAGLEARKRDAIRAEKASIANSVDALRDLLTAESAYQLALGNFERAAAVMQSVASSEMPPDIEVIDSTRGSDVVFTSRLVLHVDPGRTTSPWPGVGMTLRALTEPGLNHWLGESLGDPGLIRCHARALAADGTTLLDGGGQPVEASVSLAELGVQALDFVYLIRHKLQEGGSSELEMRVRHAFARKLGLADGVPVRLEFARSGDDANPDLRAFAEVLPLADALGRVMKGARPLHARDYEPADRSVVAPGANPGNVDTVELGARVTTVATAMRGLFASLVPLVADARTLATSAAAEALRGKLVELADAGFSQAFPSSSSGGGANELGVLVQQGDALLTRFAALDAATTAALGRLAGPDISVAERLGVLSQITKAWLGDDFVLVPRFRFRDTVQVASAHAGRDGLLKHAREVLGMPLPVDEWLHGVALVRPAVRVFELARVLHDAVRPEPLAVSPLQLPFTKGASWLAMQFPATTKVLDDTVAIAQCCPHGFDPEAAQCAFLIDEWVESIPRRDEVTGLTFNYNQPQSAPPQALLLVVTPEETGRWQWRHLVASVRDTFSRAKRRAVEPDMVGEMVAYGNLLPALIAEFSTTKSSISLDYSLNLETMQKAVIDLPSTSGGG